ncbi:MAG: helix-turn-helix domain-containing protein [Gemmatimonadota bacterium]
MKSAIVRASRDLLVRQGMGGWTIEEVSKLAPCAKGLVIYHFQSKANLLAQTAAMLREERITRRLVSLRDEGAAALDLLWSTMHAEVKSGAFAAWMALSALPDEQIHQSLRPTGEEVDKLQAAFARSLAIENPKTAETLESVLAGFQTALLHDHNPDAVREVYYQFWLSLLPM